MHGCIYVYMDVDRRRIVKIYILPTLEVKTSLDSGTQYSGLVILCEYRHPDSGSSVFSAHFIRRELRST